MYTVRKCLFYVHLYNHHHHQQQQQQQQQQQLQQQQQQQQQNHQQGIFIVSVVSCGIIFDQSVR